MSSTILANGSITFGDNTTLSSANVTLTQVSGAPTALSSFTNDLGNYGGFMTSTNIDPTQANAYAGNEIGYRYLYWDGSKAKIVTTNCNCNCNC